MRKVSLSVLTSLILIAVAMLVSTPLMAQFQLDEPTRFGIKLPDGTTFMNVTKDEYDIGDKFNITVHIEDVDPAMLSYGVSVTWNATFCNATERWWLSPFMKAEVTAGHWSGPFPPAITNDYFGVASPLVGFFEGLGQMSYGRDYDLTGSFDICIIEFQVNAYGPLEFYIWKEPTHYAPHPYTAGQPYLAYEGAFPEAYHPAYTTYAYPPAGAPANYSVIWVPQFPGITANGLLWIQPPMPYPPEAVKTVEPEPPIVNETVTVTVTQTEAGFDGTAYYDISNVTIDWGEPGPIDWMAPVGGVATFTHNYTSVGPYDINVYCYADGMPPDLAWCNLTNPIEVVPEFPAYLLIPLFLTATLIAVVVAKAVWFKKPRGSRVGVK